MLLEDQVNWALVFGLIALVGWLLAAFALISAHLHRSRREVTSTQLDVVQRVAKDADKKLLETLNAIPVALVETDAQGKFVFANRAAHELLGRRDTELIGLRFHAATWGITFEDGRPIPPDMLPSARALRGQTVRGFEHMMVNPQTREKMRVVTTAMPIEDDAGRVLGSTAAIVHSDGLGPRLQPIFDEVEPARAVSSDLARRVFDAAQSALLVVGLDGVIRDANATARRMTSQALTGQDFADAFLEEDERAAVRHDLRRALVDGREDIDPIISRRGVQWFATLLRDEAGKPDAIALAGERHDPAASPQVPTAAAAAAAAASVAAGAALSQEVEARLEAQAETMAELEAQLADAHSQVREARTEAEAALTQAEQARDEARQLVADAEQRLAGGQRMETVGRLTGGLAHDFESLLQVMTGALDLMLNQSHDPARVRRIGEAALTAGRKGESLVRRMTAFSQGEDGPVRQVMDVGVLLRGLEGRLRGLAGPRIDLMIETPSDSAVARVDPVAFEGAVKALVLNAVEASGQEGSVAVRLETLMSGGLRLSVRDSGPGMDRELATRAIEPFFTTRDGAAGLGLSQAYAFARQSGGVLSIDSGPSEGAEVSITLPEAA